MTIREAREDDCAAIIAVRNALGVPWPEKARTVEALRELDRTRGPEKFCRRWVAEGEAGVVGFSSCVQGWPYNGKKTLMAEVAVLEGWRGRGLGARLFATLREAAERQGPAWLCADSYSLYPRGAGFLAARGFRETWRETPVELDVASASLDAFEEEKAALERQGFSFRTMADLAGDPGRDEKLYRLYTALAPTVPCEDGYVYEAPSFEDWREEQIDDPSTLPEAYQVVLFGDRWIGLKEVGKGAAPGSVACGLMAVAPEFRRRGLARVMQRKTIEYAKRSGCAVLKSCTATCNFPMQELYASLGYRRLYEWSQHMMEIQGAG